MALLPRTMFFPPQESARKISRAEVLTISKSIISSQMMPMTIPARKFHEVPAFNPLLGIMASKLAMVKSDLEVCPDSLIMFSYLSDRPGMAVLYAYALVRYTSENGKFSLLEDIPRVFEHGLPTEEYAHSLWDEQKYFNGAKDNFLDTPEAWEIF